MKAILLAVGAGLCWGIGELFTRSVLHGGRVGPVTAIAVRSTIALPLLWLAYVLAMHVWKVEPRGWTAAGTGTLAKLALGSGVIAGGLGMICFYSALHLGEASRIKPVAFTVAPAVAVMLGILVLGEEFTVRKMIAVALVLSGIVLLTAR
jgi:transporter family protein